MFIAVTNTGGDAAAIMEAAQATGALPSDLEGDAGIVTTRPPGQAPDEMRVGSVFMLPERPITGFGMKAASPLLLNTAFTLALLAVLARRAPVFISDLPDRRPAGSPRLATADLDRHPDIFGWRRFANGCIRLQLAPQAAVPEEETFSQLLRSRFPTIVAWLHDAMPEFLRRYELAAADFVDRERLQTAFGERQLLYTLMGVLQKGAFLDARLAARFGDRPVRLLDLGAGYGALAVEMALKGHTCTAVELEPAKVEHLGRWLARCCAIEDRVDLQVGDFDRVHQLIGNYDAIAFFGALLYHPRERLDDLLGACARRLGPDGVLIVHELPRSRSAPTALDYDRQFDGPDLDAAIRQHFEAVEYRSVFTHRQQSLAEAAEGVLLLEACRGS